MQASKNVQLEALLVYWLVVEGSFSIFRKLLTFFCFFRKEMHNFEGCFYYSWKLSTTKEEAAAAKVYKLDRDQENLTLLGVILCVILFKWFSQCHLFPFWVSVSASCRSADFSLSHAYRVYPSTTVTTTYTYSTSCRPRDPGSKIRQQQQRHEQ